MKTILLLTTLTVCFGLNWAMYKPTPPPYAYTPPPPKYEPKTTPPPPSKTPAQIYKEQLDKTWFNPKPSLKKKITLTVQEYGVWTSLAKFVPKGGELRPTHVERFCKCKKPYGKRSLMSRLKRDDHNEKKKKKKDKQKDDGEQVVRKEWRRMSKSMRKSFIKHFNNLARRRGNETQSRLTQFANWHRESEAPGAHFGPAFLPWHREYLYRFENFLKADGYKGGIPYWNSGLDSPMPSARDSAIFTTSELGVSNGNVGNPFLRNTVSRDCEDASLPSTVTRDAKEASTDLFSSDPEGDLQMNADYLTFSRDLEANHGGTHMWFGANGNVHMTDFSCVGFDPIFYMHHAFVDYLWEQFREKQSVKDRENDYPINLSIRSPHHKYRDMLPFDDKEVIDGMKIQYTNSFYRYEKSPGRCRNDRACKSGFLWCNSNGRCQGKTREGGECDRNLRDIQCYCNTGNPSCQIQRNGPPRCGCT